MILNNEVLQDLNDAKNNRVGSVPFFVLNNKYAFSGAQSYEQMVDMLKVVMEEAAKETGNETAE